MPLYAIHDANPSRVYVFPEDTPNNGRPSGSDLAVWMTTSDITNPHAITISGSEVVIINSTDRAVSLFPVDTADGATAVRRLRYLLPSNRQRPHGAAVLGNDLLVLENEWQGYQGVYVIPLSVAEGERAVISRTFSFPSAINNAEGLWLDGNDLYICNVGASKVFVVPADTANGAEATITRQFDIPSPAENVIGIAKVGSELYLNDPADRKIYVVSANTANGTTAVISRQFNMPTNLDTCE